MRHSPLRHPLAILRQIIGLGQKELGEIVGRSPRTIQSIELGRHALSEELAHRISHETSVSFAWLIDADPQAEPWVHGPLKLPYRKEHFEMTRALLASGKEPTLRDLLTEAEAKLMMTEEEWRYDQKWMEADQPIWSLDLPSEVRTMLAALEAASRVGRGQLVLHRISKFANALQDEFGQSYNDAFLNRYTSLLNECLLSIEGTRASLKKDGNIFWSPFVSEDKWCRGKTVMHDIYTPEEVLKEAGITREQYERWLPEIVKFGFKGLVEELKQRAEAPLISTTTSTTADMSAKTQQRKKKSPRP